MRLCLCEELLVTDPNDPNHRYQLAWGLANLGSVLGWCEETLAIDRRASEIMRKLAGEFPDRPMFGELLIAAQGNHADGLRFSWESERGRGYSPDGPRLGREARGGFPRCSRLSASLGDEAGGPRGSADGRGDARRFRGALVPSTRGAGSTVSQSIRTSPGIGESLWNAATAAVTISSQPLTSLPGAADGPWTWHVEPSSWLRRTT